MWVVGWLHLATNGKNMRRVNACMKQGGAVIEPGGGVKDIMTEEMGVHLERDGCGC